MQPRPVIACILHQVGQYSRLPRSNIVGLNEAANFPVQTCQDVQQFNNDFSSQVCHPKLPGYRELNGQVVENNLQTRGFLARYRHNAIISQRENVDCACGSELSPSSSNCLLVDVAVGLIAASPGNRVHSIPTCGIFAAHSRTFCASINQVRAGQLRWMLHIDNF